MSQKNVEIVQGIFDRWATGDFGAGLTSLDPDVGFVVRHPFPEAVLQGLPARDHHEQQDRHQSGESEERHEAGDLRTARGVSLTALHRSPAVHNPQS